jgi:hypothetical protein
MPEDHQSPSQPEGIEMPRPTTAPMILALGIVLLGAGVALSLALSVVGAVIFLVGLAAWIGDLLPGRGHSHVQALPPECRPRPIAASPGTVEQLQAGMPGYRMRLPLKVHPISAGIKGGLLGGLLMPIPALLWGLISGHGIWYPVNLLAGMVIALDDRPVAELERFHFSLFLAGFVIHAVMSAAMGLIYGVLLPTLPYIHRSLAWGGLLMPMLWTAVSFPLMSIVNPVLHRGVSWPWFILSQFLFGVVAGPVVMQATAKRHPLAAGILGGLAGGLLMTVPAALWGLATGHGIWYPANLLAGMFIPGMDELPLEGLTRFRGDWLAVALLLHLLISAGFGILYAFLLPKLPAIPAPLTWGGVLMPLVWTGVSYGLMGVINPVLQGAVDWPWFIASQFVFGITAAIVVIRTEEISVRPAGRGTDTEPLIAEEDALRVDRNDE